MDMDAFFASVEQASNPALKGQPIGVIGSQERTVVVTCSYEARKFGVRTGMSKYEALRVCPHLKLVPGRNRKYTYISKQITDYLLTITPDVEVYSVDEAFLDISDVLNTSDEISYMIKSFVKKNFGITCSLGVGSNKLIAKMASGIKKPDGYYKVESGDEIDFIDRFKLGDIWGIGRRLEKRFNNMGIFKPKDLREFGEDKLTDMLGINGSHLYRMVCGEYLSGVNTDDPPVKSIGHSMTLPTNLYNREQAANYLLQLSEMVSARARKNSYAGKTISLHIRDIELQSVRKMKTIPFFTSATHHIYETVMEIFDEIWEKRPIRALGVSISKLVPGLIQLSTTMDADKRWDDIYKAIDSMNGKYGDFTLSFGSVLNCKRIGSRGISPAWRPKGARDVDVL